MRLERADVRGYDARGKFSSNIITIKSMVMLLFDFSNETFGHVMSQSFCSLSNMYETVTAH